MSEPPDEDRDAPEGRSARAILFVRQRFDGACFAFPVASVQHASFGSEEDVLAEQALFLREYLARARPDAISRLSLPEGARLVEVGVAIPREDLPRKLRCDVPVSFPCVVVPARARGRTESKAEEDHWVIVPAVGHTFYVEAGEALEGAIRQEVRRLLASQDLSAWEHFSLLPGRAHRLETLRVPLPEPERAGGAAPLRKALAERAKRKKAVLALAAVGTPLHATWSPSGPLTQRDAELARLGALLEGDERLGVLLVGPEHAGKTALVQAWLAGTGDEAKGEGGRPPRARPLVYATSGAQLVAGMSGLGQWQERLHDVMEAAHAIDAVLYFENLEDLLAERTEGGGLDLAGAMRPYLEQGKVRLLAEIREDRLDALEGRHWAFFAGLARIRVEPLGAAQALEALRRRAAHDARAEPHRPKVAPEALPSLVDLADRYLPYGAFPGKAIRLYEDLRALREKEQTAGGEPVTIGRSDLYEVFSIRTGVPAFLLRDDLPLRVEDVAARLRRQIIGQEQAVRALAETIGVVKAGLQPSGKPLSTFLFVGPTGVGKTELARALAYLLFGSADRMVRFDMSEFMTPDAADRLIRGADGADGLLTQRVREQPFCVLLLDEIEKAHRAVFDLLLQVTGEGRLSDARGRTAYFHNAILIMTSNLGTAERRTPAGFAGEVSSDEAHYVRIVQGAFRPELVNRIDRIVPFRALSRGEVAEVARIAVDRVAHRRGLAEAGIALSLDGRALARLAEDGYSEAYGARALRRHVEEHLGAPLARMLAKLGGEARDLDVYVSERGAPEGAEAEAGDAPEGAVVAAAEHGALFFEARRKRSAKLARQTHGIDEIGRLRRDVDGWKRLGPIEDLEEQLDFLVTQLNLAKDGPADRRRDWETASLQTEHHRLNELWKELSKAQEEMHSVEELAMMALFEGQDVSALAGDARAAWHRFRKVLPYGLVALEPRRDAITLVFEELDEGAFERWLRPLLRELPRRSWIATLHIDGDRAGPEAAAWPGARRWGPPRTPAYVLGALERRSFRNVLFRCKGPYAAALLALEVGLHRMTLSKSQGDEGDDKKHVFVHRVGFDAEIDGEQWDHKSLTPPPAGSAGARRRGAAAREHDYTEGAILVAARRSRVAMQPEAYWPNLEEISLHHLLLFETEGSGLDRDDYYLGPAGAVE